MSLIERFSARSLCIGLTPSQMTCVIRKANNFIANGASRFSVDNPEGDWQPVLAVLEHYLLQAEHVGSGLPLSFVLSSNWCRMMMVPWSDMMLQHDTANRFIQMQYTALFGDAAQGWTFTYDDAPYGQPRMACAIDSELLLRLQQLAHNSQHGCQSIEPVISAAWRSVSHLMGRSKELSGFVVVESDRLSLAITLHGKITAIQTQHWERAWPVELAHAWQRTMLRNATLANIGEVWVLNLTGDAIKGDLPKPFRIVTLPTYELEPAYRFITCARSR